MTKLTRKLFISIMTLVLTVMALGTSTFAWFSMNTTVNANGMTVTAKSNATYLFIANSQESAGVFSAPTIAQIQSGAQTAVTTLKVDGTANNDRYPCEFNNTGATAYIASENGTVNDQGQAWTSGTKYTAVNNETWYTASSTSSASSTTNVTNVKSIAAADLNKYTVKYDVYLALSPDSEDYDAHNYVKLTFSLGENDDEAISAVVLIQGTYYKLNSTNNVQYHELTSAITGSTSGSAVKAEIFIYVDGNSDNVYSDYINGTGAHASDGPQDITGTVGIQFDLTFANGGQAQQGGQNNG